jgi:Flp pilus assembly protein TadB
VNRLRLVLAIGGLVFAVAGIATEDRRIVWAAIGLLGASFLIRMVVRRRDRERQEE